MDASSIQPKTDPFINTAPSLPTKNVNNIEPTIETQANGTPVANYALSNGSINISDAALKLSASSPVQSSDKTAPIENTTQAQQALSKILADFQSNPSLAQGAHSNVFSGAVKSLLG